MPWYFPLLSESCALQRADVRPTALAFLPSSLMLAGFGFAANRVPQSKPGAQPNKARLLFANILHGWRLRSPRSAGLLGTADCVSSEKRDGTLGLLFLTDLKGYDVICGKLAANSVSVLYGLCSRACRFSAYQSSWAVLGAMEFEHVVLLLLTVLALSCSHGDFYFHSQLQ